MSWTDVSSDNLWENDGSRLRHVKGVSPESAGLSHHGHCCHPYEVLLQPREVRSEAAPGRPREIEQSWPPPAFKSVVRMFNREPRCCVLRFETKHTMTSLSILDTNVDHRTLQRIRASEAQLRDGGKEVDGDCCLRAEGLGPFHVTV